MRQSQKEQQARRHHQRKAVEKRRKEEEKAKDSHHAAQEEARRLKRERKIGAHEAEHPRFAFRNDCSNPARWLLLPGVQRYTHQPRLKNKVPDFTKQQQEFADQLTKRKAALKAKVEKTAPKPFTFHGAEEPDLGRIRYEMMRDEQLRGKENVVAGFDDRWSAWLETERVAEGSDYLSVSQLSRALDKVAGLLPMSEAEANLALDQMGVADGWARKNHDTHAVPQEIAKRWVRQRQHEACWKRVQKSAEHSNRPGPSAVKVLADILADDYRLAETRWPHLGPRTRPQRSEPPPEMYHHMEYDAEQKQAQWEAAEAAQEFLAQSQLSEVASVQAADKPGKKRRPPPRKKPMERQSDLSLDDASLKNIYGRVDKNADGLVTRAELIKTVRSDAAVREALGLPRQIREGPGRVQFEETFQAMDADDSRGIKFAEFAAFMRQNLPRRQPAESAAVPCEGDAVQRTAEAEPAPATPRQEEEADPHPQMDAATPPTPAPDDDADEPEPPNTAIQMAAAAAEFVENQVKW